LIQTYPSALLDLGPPTTDDHIHPDDYIHPPIYMIAYHPQHCVLMPWIATNYTWVLDHERCPPVVFGLLDMYTSRRRTSCTASAIQNFFETYPRALTQKYPEGGNSNILHKILNDYEIECEADLFKWMAEQCPSSTLLETNSNGYTPLHYACNLLARHKGRNSSEICKYLIKLCPESVRSMSMINHGSSRSRSRLPIHFLQQKCRYRLVREVVVCLLREYLESYDVPTDDMPIGTQMSPCSIPFIQSIKPHLDEEKELKETAASLKESSSTLTKAVTCTNDQLIRSAFAVFDSWSTSFINNMEDKLQLISTQLQEMCNEGRESDE